MTITWTVDEKTKIETGVRDGVKLTIEPQRTGVFWLIVHKVRDDGGTSRATVAVCHAPEIARAAAETVLLTDKGVKAAAEQPFAGVQPRGAR